MIVQCQKCQTKFNIDETLIKKEGTKVRCSRCEDVFLVSLPEPIEVEAPSTEAHIQPQADLDNELMGESGEMDLDFDDSFEEDMMEDFEDLEVEFQQDPQGVSGQVDIEVSPEGVAEESAEKLEELEKDESSDLIDSHKKKKNVSRTLLILFIIVLGLFGLIFAVIKYGPSLIPDTIMPDKKPSDVPTTVDLGARRLEILTVDGSFVDSEKAGRLFVISGKVRNNYPAGRSFILIKGCILDDKGKTVMEKNAYAGNIFKEEDLKSLPMDGVASAMQNRHGTDNQNVNVKSGTTMDFMIVFDALPDNMSEFTVGVISSSPANQKAEPQK